MAPYFLGFGFWVLGFGFWVLGFGFWVLGFGFLGFWVWGLNLTQSMHACACMFSYIKREVAIEFARIISSLLWLAQAML